MNPPLKRQKRYICQNGWPCGGHILAGGSHHDVSRSTFYNHRAKALQDAASKDLIARKRSESAEKEDGAQASECKLTRSLGSENFRNSEDNFCGAESKFEVIYYHILGHLPDENLSEKNVVAVLFD